MTSKVNIIHLEILPPMSDLAWIRRWRSIVGSIDKFPRLGLYLPVLSESVVITISRFVSTSVLNYWHQCCIPCFQRCSTLSFALELMLELCGVWWLSISVTVSAMLCSLFFRYIIYCLGDRIQSWSQVSAVFRSPFFRYIIYCLGDRI